MIRVANNKYAVHVKRLTRPGWLSFCRRINKNKSQL